MRRLRLIIADNDKDYIQNLVRYILNNYTGYFEVHSFTKKSFLSEYLETSGDHIDILLLGKEFINELQQVKKPGVCIILTEDNVNQNMDGIECVFKFQHAESLITRLISIYSGSIGEEFLNSGQNTTHIIAVFSGEGGSGKTSIAAVGSKVCAKRGGKVLYINLESVCSTNALFSGDSGQTISNVIYYLKENSGNLVSKIEGARCVEPDTGICYFRPPENLHDIEEMLFEDAELFLKAIKKAGLYDYVFVDLSTGFTPRNLAVLRNCDYLIRISTPRQGINTRQELLRKEYESMYARYGVDIESKSIDVINMNRNHKSTAPVNSIGYYPDMEQQSVMVKEGYSEFFHDVGRLLDSIILTINGNVGHGG